MTKRISILLLLAALLTVGALTAKTTIDDTGRGGGRQGGVINVRGGWSNHGGFGANGGTVRFCGAEQDTINSSVTDTLYNMVVDKPGAELLLNSMLVVENTLYLKSGLLTSIDTRSSELFSSTRQTYTPVGQKLTLRVQQGERSRLLDTETYVNPSPLPRLGVLTLAHNSELVREDGAIAFSPVYAGDVDITYAQSCGTGPEITSLDTNLRVLSIENDVSVTLQGDLHVDNSMVLRQNALLNLSSYECEMGLTAPVTGYPEQIVGDLTGQPYHVGTSSYNNSSLGVSLTSGADIGDLGVVEYLRQTTIGDGETVRRQWDIYGDSDPGDRNLGLTWPYPVDNGVDLAKAQAFCLFDGSWYAVGDPQDLSGAGTYRNYPVEGFGEWGRWTIGESQFLLSDDVIDFGNVIIGESQTVSVTITNDQPSVMQGYIASTGAFTVTEASRSATMDFNTARTQRFASTNRDTRNTMYFNLAAYDSATYDITFTPTEATSYSEYVLVRKTGDGNPSRVIEVSGAGLTPASMAVTPESLADTLFAGATNSHTLTVTNDGDTDLNWSAEALSYQALFIEDFEGNFPPAGWTNEVLEQTIGWEQNGSLYHSSSHSAVADWHNAYDARLYTDTFTVPANAKLNWWMRTQDSPLYGGNFIIEVSTTVGSWDTLLFASQDDYTTTFQNYEVDLSAYAGMSVNIGFRVTDNYWNDGIIIDDVAVIYPTATPPAWLTLDGGSTTSGVAAAGGSSTVSVGINATGLADGAYSASVRFQSDSPETPEQNVPVSLIVATPQIEIYATSIDFGDVLVGDTALEGFSIANPGNATLEAMVTTPAGFSVVSSRAVIEPLNAEMKDDFSASEREPRNGRKSSDNHRNSVGYSIPAYHSATVFIEFTPTAETAYSGDITITHNGPSPSETLPVSGTGVTPHITASPGSFSSTLMTGESETDLLTIGNTGTAELDWSAVVMYGGDRDQLLYSGFEDAVPPAGWSTEVLEGDGDWIRVSTMVHADTYAAMASWATVDDARLVTPPFMCSADAVLSYWIRCQDQPNYNGVFAVEVSVMGDDWTTLDSYDQDTLTQTFTEKLLTLGAYDGQYIQLAFRASNNYYQEGVVIDEVLVTGSAAPTQWLTLDDGLAVGGEIAAGGANESITVGYDADGLSDGDYTANIVVMSNDADYPSITLPVTLTVATPGVAVSPGSMYFSALEVGETATQSFTIQNTGNALLSGDINTPDGFTVTPIVRGRSSESDERNASDFSSTVTLRETEGYTVAAGQTETYELTFAPTSYGDYTGQVVITHNAPGDDEVINITASAYDEPTVTTATVSGITSTSAQCGGEVTDDGNYPVSQRGVCWSMSPNPTTAGSHTVDGSGTGAFTSAITGLAPYQLYYVRAYAINAAGTSYGAEASFTTATPNISVSGGALEFGETVVGQVSAAQTYTVSASNLVDNLTISAPSQFEIALTANGRTNASENTRDFGPEIVLTPTSGEIASTTIYVRFAPNAANDYAFNISNASPNATTKFVAVSGSGVELAALSTTAISNITSTSAQSGGDVTDDGNASVTQRGVCWSILPNPTTVDSLTVDGSGTGAFTSAITGLAPNQLYYVRAYAINAAGTSYGNEVSFTTLFGSLDPPQNLLITLAGSQVTLAWDEVTNANSYYIYAADSPEGPWTNVTASGAFGGSTGRVDWTASDSGERHYFYVIATTDVTR